MGNFVKGIQSGMISKACIAGQGSAEIHKFVVNIF